MQLKGSRFDLQLHCVPASYLIVKVCAANFSVFFFQNVTYPKLQ